MKLNNVNVGRAEGFEYNGTVKNKENPIYINGRKTYPRDKQTSINALVHANYDIVSLCSNCHNQIHYGIDSDKLITKLYEERKELLESVGIKISLERLLLMYGYK